MLSEDIADVAGYLAREVERNPTTHLMPHAIGQIVAVMRAWADCARALEEAPVPPHLRVPVALASDEHGRVLSLEAWRGRLHRPGPPVGPGIGGDAA